MTARNVSKSLSSGSPRSSQKRWVQLKPHTLHFQSGPTSRKRKTCEYQVEAFMSIIESLTPLYTSILVHNIGVSTFPFHVFILYPKRWSALHDDSFVILALFEIENEFRFFVEGNQLTIGLFSIQLRKRSRWDIPSSYNASLATFTQL